MGGRDSFIIAFVGGERIATQAQNLKGLLRLSAAICVFAPLSESIVLALFSSGYWQMIIVAGSSFAVVSGVTMVKSWRMAFSIAGGSQLVLLCSSCILGTNLGFGGAWFVLGVGLAGLLIGDQVLVSRSLYDVMSESSLSSKAAIIAMEHSFWRILFFVASVMACSLLVLFLILAMDIGSLSLPFLLVAGLLAMVSLYYLATRGTTSGDEEKPNI